MKEASRKSQYETETHSTVSEGAVSCSKSQAIKMKDKTGCLHPDQKGKSSLSKRSVFGSLTRKNKCSELTSLSDPQNSSGCPKQEKMNKGRFFNVFKWLSKKNATDKKPIYSEENAKGSGSTTSLVSDFGDNAFSPIRHSASADNTNSMIKSFKAGNDQRDMRVERHRRSSLTSTHSNESGSSFIFRSRKRRAPGLPSAKVRETTTTSTLLCGAPEKADSCGESEKSKLDAVTSSKPKRKAPPPPNSGSKNSVRYTASTGAATSVDNSIRPMSTCSNFSFVRQSSSSTLKSSTFSENCSPTLRSESSQKTSASFPLCKEYSADISPKPWYKRKKSKEKTKKSSKKEKSEGYESWICEVPYARRIVNSKSDEHLLEFYNDENQKNQKILGLSSIGYKTKDETKLEGHNGQRNDPACYSGNARHMLRQEDVLPERTTRSNNKLSNKQSTDKTDHIKKGDNYTYDNVHYNGCSSTEYKPSGILLKESKSLIINNTKSDAQNVSEYNGGETDCALSEISNDIEDSGSTEYEKYIEEIRKELEIDNLQNVDNRSNSISMQDNNFDPELFYQLAKDARTSTESKTVQYSHANQTRKEKKLLTNTSDESLRARTVILPSFVKRCPPLKNFGMRMNNIFTPDVSTILEGSEIGTSSAATTIPEDSNKHLSSLSLSSINQNSEIMSQCSEQFINTIDQLEATEPLPLSSQRYVVESNAEARGDRYTETENKIREEALFRRENENFLMWQKTMQEELSNEGEDEVCRKKKWECNSCTLINQPWRLHCEACGMLRPPRPKRVNEESISSSKYAKDVLAAPCSVSVASVHDNRDRRDLNTNSSVSDFGVTQTSLHRINGEEFGSSSNWESELQGYFSTFDGQSRSNMKEVRPDVRDVQCAERLGKSSPLRTRNEIGERQVIERNTKAQSGNILDIQEIRLARVRKFQFNCTVSEEQTDYSFDRANNLNEISVSRVVNGSEESFSLRDVPYQIENQAVRSLTEVLPPFQSPEEINKTDNKQYSAIKTSGAVKSFVSIFNQMNQMQAVQQKPPPVKAKNRKTSASILNYVDFEKLISESNNDLSKASANRPISPIIVDIDIASAISKFDEMAAMAEIENLKHAIPKIHAGKPKPELTNNPHTNNRLVNTTSNGEFNTFAQTDNDPLVSHASPLPMRKASSNSILSDETKSPVRPDSRDSRGSIIRDGVLYVTGSDSKRRSMSIGSGTFELINAKDFASIEAHHSQRPSPTGEFDVISASELSHPLLMPEIRNELKLTVIPNFSQRSETNNVLDSDIENLSSQLIKEEGIAAFKASLAEDQSHLDPAGIRVVNLLMRKVEDAVRSGNKNDAIKWARDLAYARLSCPPGKGFRNPASEHGVNKSRNSNVESRDRDANPYNQVGDDEAATVSQNSTRESVIKRETAVNPCRRKVKPDTNTLQVKQQKTTIQEKEEFYTAKMYIEDKWSHQGPFPLSLFSQMTVGGLKLKVFEEFGFPIEVQRWILGRGLADEDCKFLSSHNVNAEGCPIFLYLVDPETDMPNSSKFTPPSSSNTAFVREAETSEVSFSSGAKDKRVYQAQFSQKQSGSTSRDANGPEQQRSSESNEISLTKTPKGSPHLRKELQREDVAKPSKPLSSSESHTRLSNHQPQLTKLGGASDRMPSSTNKEECPQTSNLDGGWICPQCTLINPRDRPGCEACASERPESFSSSREKTRNLTQAMTALDAQGCVPNLDPFECSICFLHFDAREGVVLRDCLHIYCRNCLKLTIKYSDTARVKCPFGYNNNLCQFSLQEREIKDLLDEEDYRKHLDKSIREAAGSMRNIFYCKTPDCQGFCQFEDNVNVFSCYVCKKNNCLTCQVQHEGITCKQYQDDLAHKQDEETLKTKKFFDEIIRRGDGMLCPQCSIMLVRKWGCDWMRCPMCRTEICWITQGPRWGPEGQGDTSGGCRCGINGRKCHPKCTYCH